MKPETFNPDQLIQKKNDLLYGVKANPSMTVQDVDLSKRIVTGYFNTCFFLDSDADVSIPGCMNKSIGDRGPKSSATGKIKHLKDHNWSTIPGKIEVLEEKTFDYKGVKVTGTYFETKMSNTQLGTDTLINYQEGVYDNHSFGFRYVDIEMIDEESDNWKKYLDQLINPEDATKLGYMFVVHEYKMYEGSTVGLGANQLTPFLGVKSGNRDAVLLKLNDRFTLLQKQLKSGTQSDEMLQSLEMEVLQLQQLTKELFDEGPSIKDTLLHEREQRRQEKDLPLSDTIKSIKFFNK